MNEELVVALKNARSAEQVAEAFEAGVQAAYRNHPRAGYAAALEILAPAAPAVEADAPAASDPSQPANLETT